MNVTELLEEVRRRLDEGQRRARELDTGAFDDAVRQSVLRSVAADFKRRIRAWLRGRYFFAPAAWRCVCGETRLQPDLNADLFVCARCRRSRAIPDADIIEVATKGVSHG